MTTSSPQKTSWLSAVLSGKTPPPATAPATTTVAPQPAPIPQAPSDLASRIQAGKGTLDQDPQSGSIMKLLEANGFAEKIRSGYDRGHAYTIIHNPPSTEFLLIDSWNENGEPRKHYQAFTIKTSEPRPKPVAVIPASTPVPTPSEVTTQEAERVIANLNQLLDQAHSMYNL